MTDSSTAERKRGKRRSSGTVKADEDNHLLPFIFHMTAAGSVVPVFIDL